MSALWRPKYSFWTLNGKRCKSGTPGAVKHKGQSPRWRGRYKDENGNDVETSLSDHKATAKAMLAELQRQADLARVGLGDPYRKHRNRPLAEHVQEFIADVRHRGVQDSRVTRLQSRLDAVLGEMKASQLDHITASGVTAALAKLREEGDRKPVVPNKEQFTAPEVCKLTGYHKVALYKLARRVGARGTGRGAARRYSRAEVVLMVDGCRGMGVGTGNSWLGTIKQFTRWLVRDRRIANDPLIYLRRQNAAVDVRRRRRALTEEEFGLFVAAAAGGRILWGLSGPVRLILYTLAAHTGLRTGELESLTPASFDWQRLTVTVAARVSKHRREDVLAIRPDVADMMRQHAAGVDPDQPLFPGTWRPHAAEMIREDLQAAGIPYEVAGRVADFHGLRSCMPSWLAGAGVAPQVVKELARHSNITLTLQSYTDPAHLDVRGALNQMPPLPSPQKGEEEE